MLKILAQKYVAPEDDQDEWLDTPWDETDVVVLHRFFDKHADKVGKELLSTTKPSDDGDDELTTGSNKRMWNVVCNALVDTSHVSVIPQLSDFPSESHSDYKDLMRRYQHRDTMSVRLLFQPAITTKVIIYIYIFVSSFQLTPCQENFALFVLSVSKLDVEALDFELLMYYIFKVGLSVPQSRCNTYGMFVRIDVDLSRLCDRRLRHHLRLDCVLGKLTTACPLAEVCVRTRPFGYPETLQDVSHADTERSRSQVYAAHLQYHQRYVEITLSARAKSEPLPGAAISDICAMHTSTSELLGNYPVGTVLPSLSYACKSYCVM